MKAFNSLLLIFCLLIVIFCMSWQIVEKFAGTTPDDLEIRGILQDMRIETAVRICRERGLAEVGNKVNLEDLVAMGLLTQQDCKQPERGRIFFLNKVPPVNEPYSIYVVDDEIIIPVGAETQIAQMFRLGE